MNLITEIEDSLKEQKEKLEEALIISDKQMKEWKLGDPDQMDWLLANQALESLELAIKDLEARSNR